MYEETEIDELAPWLVVLLTLSGLGLRVLLLDSKGIWLDEAFSVWVAKFNVPEMLQTIVKFDQHPPLYYLLLHYWMAIKGDSVYNIRLLSVLFGAGTIPIIYLIGKRLSNVVVGLGAAVLLAVSPFNIFYAQETRMYTLLAFNVAVASYALVRLLTDPRSTKPIGSQFLSYLRALRKGGTAEPEADKEPGDKQNGDLYGQRRRWPPIQDIETDLAWVTFIIFSAATLLSHNTAVFFPLATNLFVLGLMLYQRIRKSGPLPAFQAPSVWNWVKAQVGIFILWCPWLPAFIQQSSRVYNEFWLPKPTWDTVVTTLRSFLNASGPVPFPLVMLALYVLALCAGLVYFRKKLSMFVFLAVLFATPVVGELLVSLRRPIFMDRTLIWISIPLFLFLAAGVAQFRFRMIVLLTIGIFATYNVFTASDYFRFYHKEDWNDPAGYVAYNYQKDDLVLFNSTMVQLPFDYYFRTYEQQYSLQVEKHGVPEDMSDAGILEPIMTDKDVSKLVSLVSGRSRVWLVYSHNSYTDPKGIIPQTLGQEMKLIQEREFYGVKVQLYGGP